MVGVGKNSYNRLCVPSLRFPVSQYIQRCINAATSKGKLDDPEGEGFWAKAGGSLC